MASAKEVLVAFVAAKKGCHTFTQKLIAEVLKIFRWWHKMRCFGCQVEPNVKAKSKIVPSHRGGGEPAEARPFWGGGGGGGTKKHDAVCATCSFVHWTDIETLGKHREMWERGLAGGGGGGDGKWEQLSVPSLAPVFCHRNGHPSSSSWPVCTAHCTHRARTVRVPRLTLAAGARGMLPARGRRRRLRGISRGEISTALISLDFG